MANAISWEAYLIDLARDLASQYTKYDPLPTDPDLKAALNKWVKNGSRAERRREAAAVILNCHLAQLEELNLGDGLQEGFGLRTLPDCIGNLTHLRVIRLIGNQLAELPTSIGFLSRLQAVYLFGNRLSQLPDSMCRCEAIERLYLAGNRLAHLPEAIGALRKLRVLSVPGNCLTSLPESMGALTRLQDLYLFDNPLTRLPASLGQLKNLKRVHFGNPKLREEFRRLAAAPSKLAQE